ncbi:MAG TPA: phosphoribosyltransferase family protein [Candidatus Nanoarchaeia archaeon]|nr:phosphoribosyltransferase family protein [Candidatus Nanoarchaeia archaeon]
MAGKIVILTDDGLAMGSTMRASIELCKKNKAKKIIVAVPVAGAKVAKEIEKLVDELIVLEKPEFFRAVADSYRNWHDISDKEALEIIKKWEEFKSRR